MISRFPWLLFPEPQSVAKFSSIWILWQCTDLAFCGWVGWLVGWLVGIENSSLWAYEPKSSRDSDVPSPSSRGPWTHQRWNSCERRTSVAFVGCSIAESGGLVGWLWRPNWRKRETTTKKAQEEHEEEQKSQQPWKGEMGMVKWPGYCLCEAPGNEHERQNYKHSTIFMLSSRLCDRFAEWDRLQWNWLFIPKCDLLCLLFVLLSSGLISVFCDLLQQPSMERKWINTKDCPRKPNSLSRHHCLNYFAHT